MVVTEGPKLIDKESKTILTPPKKYITNEMLELAKKASTATISWALEAKGFRFVYMAGVLPLKPGTVMAGRAFTMRYLPRREDHNLYGPDRDKYAEHVGIESLGPGDVLVVDARGNTDAGVFGDRLVARMEYLGSAGLVTDGALRDIPYLRTQDFPLFVRAAHGYGHSAEHWAMDTQLPVACGNVLVYPGDLLVGDDDGVVMCPQALVEEIIQISIAQEEEEAFTREMIQAGASINEVHGKLPPELEARYQEWRKARNL